MGASLACGTTDSLLSSLGTGAPAGHLPAAWLWPQPSGLLGEAEQDLQGIRGGYRSNQISSWPAFVARPGCSCKTGRQKCQPTSCGQPGTPH